MNVTPQRPGDQIPATRAPGRIPGDHEPTKVGGLDLRSDNRSCAEQLGQELSDNAQPLAARTCCQPLNLHHEEIELTKFLVDMARLSGRRGLITLPYYVQKELQRRSIIKVNTSAGRRHVHCGRCH